MRTLRIAVCLLPTTLAAGACNGVSSVRPRLASDAPKTIVMVGDRPLSIVTGTPGDALASDLDGPDRRSRAQGRISGRVVDPKGRPVDGALVRLADGQGRSRAVRIRTDEAGGFTIHGLNPGSSYTLIAEADGADGPRRGRIVAESPDSRVQIRLGHDSDDPPARQVRRASDREELSADPDEPADDSEDERPPRLNEDDLPPAPEAEALHLPAASARAEPRRRTSRTAWRRGGSDGTVAESGPEPERESRTAEVPEFAARPAPVPEIDDGPNPLPPALERPPATARRPAAWRDPETSETASSPARSDVPSVAETPAPSRPADPPDLAAVPVEPPAKPGRSEPLPEPNPEPEPRRNPPVVSIPNPEPPAETPPPVAEPPASKPTVEPDRPAQDEAPKPTEPDSIVNPAPMPVPPNVEPEPAPAPAPASPTSSNDAPAPEPKPEADAAPAPPATLPVATPIEEPEPGPGPGEPSAPPGESGSEEAPGLRAEIAPPNRPTWSELAARGVSNRVTSAFPISTRPGRPDAGATPPDAMAGRERPGLPAVEGETAGSIRAACLLDGKTQRIVDFRLPDLDGKPVRLRDFDAEFILLDFWGTWCGPCLRSIPHLVELQKQYDGRLQIIGIAAEQRPPEERAAVVGRVARDLGVTYPILLAEQDGRPCPLQSALHIQAYPTMVLLDRTGHILWRDSGASASTIARLDRVLAVRTDARPGVVRR